MGLDQGSAQVTPWPRPLPPRMYMRTMKYEVWLFHAQISNFCKHCRRSGKEMLKKDVAGWL